MTAAHGRGARALCLGASLWALTGCGGSADGAAEARFQVDTLQSGVVVVRNDGRGSWEPEERWAIEPDLTLGSAASGGPEEFGGVRDVVTDAAGNLYVLDPLAYEVRVFDAQGSFRYAFGRAGQGPGEVGSPISLEWGPDGRLWLPDRPNGRYEVFLPDGTPAARYPYAPGTYGFGDRWTGDLLSTFVAERSMTFRLHLVRRRVDGGALVPVDSLPVPAVDFGETVAVNFVRDGRRFSMTVPVPLQPLAIRELRRDGGWWLSHPGDQYRIARLDAHGDTTLVVEMPYQGVPVTEADRAAALEDLGIDGAGAEMAIPDMHPPVTGLMTMPDGHLLVLRRGEGGRHTIDVFDPGGVFLGTLAHERLAGLQPMTVTDRVILGAEQDSLGIQRVVRWRVARPERRVP